MFTQDPSLDAEGTARRLGRWLEGRDLRANPFERWNAEHDRDLSSYFVDVGEFDELVRLGEPFVVFAGRGCGKTAQRQMLAAQCRPFDCESRRLVITYTYDGFEQALASAANDPYQVRREHHIRALLNLGIDALRSATRGFTALRIELRRVFRGPRLRGLLLRDGDRGRSGRRKGLGLRRRLERFVDLVHIAGLKSCMVLVDGLDEFRFTAGDVDQAMALLAPLLGTLPLIECPGLEFRFFLPQEWESDLRSRDWFRADRLHIKRISWDSRGLLDLIGRRLTYFSRREPPYEDLTQLCEEELRQAIKKELFTLAGGSPRAALILADMLLRSHCQQIDPPDLIKLEAWEHVKEVWAERRADYAMSEICVEVQTEAVASVSQVTPTSTETYALRVEGEKRLVWVGERDITGEIRSQDYRVLASLYRHQDRLCTKDLLIVEAWPETEPGGVSDQAIAASIARLRRTLEGHQPDVAYIETFRGRGYRLHPEGFEPQRVDCL